MNMQEMRYVQYGCGWCAPQGWVNFDGSPTVRFERLPLLGHLYKKNANRFPQNVHFGDIIRGLPVEDSSCDAVYCSHVLEHLALEDFRLALKNTLRILKPGGRFRFVVPDLEVLCQKYLSNPSSEAAKVFLLEACLGEERRSRTFPEFLKSWLGNSRHLWMWDYKSIVPELEGAGFVHVRKASFGDSCDAMFTAVEDKGRWEDCLGIECSRPK